MFCSAASAATLALQLRSAAPDTNALELYLYDCTTGQCFSYDFTLPAATNHTLVVRRPKPGRWLAAVNPAPFPAKPGRFVLEEIITGNVQRHTATQPGARPPGARWTDTLEIPLGRSIGPGSARVLLCELIDVAAERDAAARPWENRTGLTNLADRPVAIGTAVVRLN